MDGLQRGSTAIVGVAEIRSRRRRPGDECHRLDGAGHPTGAGRLRPPIARCRRPLVRDRAEPHLGLVAGRMISGSRRR
jgi:hypothetical protein